MNTRKLFVALIALLSLGVAVPTVAIAHTNAGVTAEPGCENVFVDGQVDGQEDDDDDGLLGGLLGGDDDENDNRNEARTAQNVCLDGVFAQAASDVNDDDDDEDGLLGGLLGGDDDEDGLLGGLLGGDDDDEGSDTFGESNDDDGGLRGN
ncbi:MAG TPA: hypothetical protein VGR26_18810 [Acidimicrobiales bacterium]|nr:hypothetical protein [Acidimicrobiales bacterium]